MLAVLVAKTVADALEPKGIYDLVIECVLPLSSHATKRLIIPYRLAQLPYLDAKHEHLWGPLQINDVVSPKVCSLA